jgi:hypothetical protein
VGILNLDKHIEVFDPTKIETRIHILGCGAVGSTVAEQLVRLGLTRITLWDFDKVEPHNIANQIYTNDDIGKEKTTALARYLCSINPLLIKDLEIKGAYVDQRLSGYLFVNIDNMDICRKIVEDNKKNRAVKAFFDFRLGLMDGQHYAALPSVPGDVDRLLKTMAFTHEEARVNVKVSACGSSLNVVAGVRLIIALGVANAMAIMQDKPYKHMILSDASTFYVDMF